MSTQDVPWTTLLTIPCLLSCQRGLRKNSSTSRITTDTRSLPCNMLTSQECPSMSAMCETCLETSISSAIKLTKNFPLTRKFKKPVNSNMVSSPIRARVLGASLPICSKKLESEGTPSPSITWKECVKVKTNLYMPLTISLNT